MAKLSTAPSVKAIRQAIKMNVRLMLLPRNLWRA